MKKILFLIILCLCFVSKVNAQDITLDKFVSVVNNGDVSKSFIKSLPKGGSGRIEAKKMSDSEIHLSYSLTIPEYDEQGNVSYNSDVFGILMIYDSNTKILKGEETIDTKTDSPISPYAVKFLNLVPFWTVEASGKYENIKGYMGSDDIIETFEKIFDKCYFEKMGVCYTEITDFSNITYMTKVELTDKGADYAISYFKQVEREKDESEFMGLLTKILIGLIIAIVVVYLLRGVILSITKQ